MPDKPEAEPAGQAGQAGAADASSGNAPAAGKLPREIGGRDGPEPTRFGDWEKNGRCIDF